MRNPHCTAYNHCNVHREVTQLTMSVLNSQMFLRDQYFVKLLSHHLVSEGPLLLSVALGDQIKILVSSYSPRSIFILTELSSPAFYFAEKC